MKVLYIKVSSTKRLEEQPRIDENDAGQYLRVCTSRVMDSSSSSSSSSSSRTSIA